MARAADGSKVSAWRQRFRRYAKSNLSVAQFCSKEGVSVPSFYFWKRKLGVASSAGGRTGRRRKTPRFRPITVVGPAPVVSARLPSGVQLDVWVADAAVVRGVVAELSCAQDAPGRGGASC
jgi:hypothetical protein